jgi:hypothetical protein
LVGFGVSGFGSTIIITGVGIKIVGVFGLITDSVKMSDWFDTCMLSVRNIYVNKYDVRMANDC